MHFVVIGGDAAGMSAAGRAKRNMPDAKVTVFEQTSDVSYSACGMPYNLADPGRDMDDLVVRRAEVFREKQGIDLLTGRRVERLDPAAKTVSGTDLDSGTPFETNYDKLLIATGASPIVPGLPGFDLPGVMALKTLGDGRNIKAYLKENNVGKVVIVGMGYIALEMCEALRARDIEVDMVKPGPVFLPWMNPDLAQIVREEVETNGAKLHAGKTIERIEPANDALQVVCSNMSLECGMVLAAIGVNPNSGIAKDAGLETGPGDSIAVGKDLVTSSADIYAAGDCADAYHIVTGKRVWIPLALRANRAGWAAADNVCGKKIELDGIAGTAVFKVFDLEVARTGLNEKEAKAEGFEPEQVTIRSRTRAHAHPGASRIWVHMVGDKKSGRLLGVQMVGKEGAAHRINAAAVALHAGMTVERFVQSDFAYAPPFGPVWDPLLTAANQLVKRLW